MPKVVREESPSPKPLSEVLEDHIEFDKDTLTLDAPTLDAVIEDSSDEESEEGGSSNFYKPAITLDLPGLTVVISPPTVADIKRAEQNAPNSEVQSNYELIAGCCLQWGDQPSPPPFEKVKARHLAALGGKLQELSERWIKDAQQQGFEVIEKPDGGIEHKVKLRDSKIAIFREPYGPDLQVMEGRTPINAKAARMATALCVKWGERNGVALPQMDKVLAWDFYLIQNAIQAFLI